MKIYIFWKNGKSGSVMDITEIIEECYKETGLQRVTIANMIVDTLSGDSIVMVENEEELDEVFPNATIISESDHNNRGEIH
ncbi:MAG: hypothetical protein ABS939_20930 [Psychrobacillus sp.]